VPGLLDRCGYLDPQLEIEPVGRQLQVMREDRTDRLDPLVGQRHEQLANRRTEHTRHLAAGDAQGNDRRGFFGGLEDLRCVEHEPVSFA